MVALSVNVNKIALLRNARGSKDPDPVYFAMAAVDCGVQGITVHPRPDLRHITPDDVINLKSKVSKVEFNIEGNPQSLPNKKYPGFLKIVKDVLPEQCTFVPDDDSQLTSDHGWSLKKHCSYLTEAVGEIQELGIRVSLFIDAMCPDLELLEKIKPARVELFTGPFANAFGSSLEEKYWQQLESIAKIVTQLNIEINAGHDLNLQNLVRMKNLPQLKEVSIGQALISEALELGWSNTIKKYLIILSK